MLNGEEIKQIGTVVEQKITENNKSLRLEFGEVMEHNITPALTELRKEMEKGFATYNARLGLVESQMVTKTYLDDKLADLEGVVVVRQRKEDEKVNLLITLLQQRAVLQPADVEQLKQIQVFPRV